MSDGDTAMRVRADQLVLRDCDDNGILRLTLNDPKTRNSLSEAMMEALASALADARDDADVRVIVIAANGPEFAPACAETFASLDNHTPSQLQRDVEGYVREMLPTNVSLREKTRQGKEVCGYQKTLSKLLERLWRRI